MSKVNRQDKTRQDQARPLTPPARVALFCVNEEPALYRPEGPGGHPMGQLARISTQVTQEATSTKNAPINRPSCRYPALCPDPYWDFFLAGFRLPKYIFVSLEKALTEALWTSSGQYWLFL